MTVNFDLSAATSGAPRAPRRTEKRKRAKYVLNIDKISQLSEAERARLKEVTKKFVFRSNDYYLSLIDWDNPNDPIRQLVIPQERELDEWGKLDASDEESITVQRGVQHKYGTTVLLFLLSSTSAFAYASVALLSFVLICLFVCFILVTLVDSLCALSAFITCILLAMLSLLANPSTHSFVQSCSSPIC